MSTADRPPFPRPCAICKGAIASLDDVAVMGSGGLATCVACYERAIEDEKPMPKELREAVEQVLKTLGGS